MPRSSTAALDRRELSSVANALRLLELLAAQRDAGVSELARALELTKPTVDRLLRTLIAAGFALQDSATKRYRLSSKIVAIADRVRSRMGIIAVARPHLEALAEDLAETVNLGELSGTSVVYLDTITSGDTFRIEVRPGSILPAYATGVGKAVLAFSPPARIDAYLAEMPRESYTAATLNDPRKLDATLRRIRRDGYAFDRGEIMDDVRCVAAPILGADGYAVAAVSVEMPRSRFAAKRDRARRLVLEAAQRIANAAGPAS